MGPGIIIITDVDRKDGPHWNEIARTLYDSDFGIETLIHVFSAVVNIETARYVKHELYPKYNRTLSKGPDGDCIIVQHGESEYQEILSTSLGKAAACLVLSSFPRGTMRISRVLTWVTCDQPMLRLILNESIIDC